VLRWRGRQDTAAIDVPSQARSSSPSASRAGLSQSSMMRYFRWIFMATGDIPVGFGSPCAVVVFNRSRQTGERPISLMGLRITSKVLSWIEPTMA
jgi:hypothetical protein